MIKLPFYAKATLILVGLYTLISMLWIGKGILLPLIFAMFFAILINPVVNYLTGKGLHRIVAIASVLVVAFLIMAAVVGFLVSQASLLSDAMPQLSAKFQELQEQTVGWLSESLNISSTKINDWLANAKKGIAKDGNAVMTQTISTMGGVLAAVLMIIVYVFLILFYKTLLLDFIYMLCGLKNNHQVDDILSETKSVVQSYLVGLFLEFLIVAALNSAGLLILGIEYAILLGVAGAALNIIPYLGGLLAMAIYAAIALVTKEPVYALYVLMLYLVIQVVDNNYIVPRIVASKVKLNALLSIIIVLAGGALWGIAGMFLWIPIMAILKLIFDRVESLKPWGLLLGDHVPAVVGGKGRRKRRGVKQDGINT